ncbi:MAG: hypothetical protein R3Y43_06900 [Alphaproteobacteria bacterium]
MEKIKDKKNIIIIIVACLLFIIFISGNEESSQKTNSVEKSIQVLDGNESLIENVNFVLNKGYKLIGKPYFAKSNDYKKVYFIGALVENSGQIYNCIWSSNSNDMSGMTMAANDYAVQASSMSDARLSDAKISSMDSGYSQVNRKILDNWSKMQ